MKKFYAILLMAFAFITNAAAMPYDEAARQAYYLTDKMAYELNLTDYQYDRVYQINLDYFLKVNSERDAYGYLWDYRNSCLAAVLYTHQYRSYGSLPYFYRPINWVRNAWCFAVHDHYGHRPDYFCRPTPPPSYHGPAYGHHNPGYRPGGNNYRPGGNGYRPGGNDHKPHGNDYRPGGSNDRPGGNNNRPGGNSYRPGGNDHKPGDGGYRPSGNNNHQPANGGGNGRRSNVNRGGR